MVPGPTTTPLAPLGAPTLAWLPHSQQARSRLVHCRQLAPEMPPAPYPCRFQPPKTSQMPVSTPCTCALQTPTPSSARLLNDAQMRDTLWYHLDCPRPGAACSTRKTNAASPSPALFARAKNCSYFCSMLSPKMRSVSSLNAYQQTRYCWLSCYQPKGPKSNGPNTSTCLE